MDGFDGRIEVEGCDTIPKLFWHQVKARDERTAFREKYLGIWRATSWRDYGEQARAVGMGLVKLGLKRGDVVSILAETVPEWLYADMATACAGGVTNGIYPTDSAKQVDYIVNDSRSRFLFVEDEEQLDKWLDVRDRCPSLTRIFVFDMEGLADFNDPMVMPIDELMALGREHDKASPSDWEKLIAGSAPEDLALLVYTSGTTGPAKGAMISHRNVIFQLHNADAFIPLGSDDEQLAFLRSATSPSAPSPPSCRCVPARSRTSPRASRPCRRTYARWRRPPSSPCRASGNASIPASPSA